MIVARFEIPKTEHTGKETCSVDRKVASTIGQETRAFGTRDSVMSENTCLNQYTANCA